MTSNAVQVAVRSRPLNRREITLNSQCCVEMHGKTTSLLHGDHGAVNEHERKFNFDYSFWSTRPEDSHFVDQVHVFNAVGANVLENVFQGYNACVFAYGQTGSGKSYTMMGPPDDHGLIPRLCHAIFSRIREHTSDTLSFKVEVSYMEIYNEKVRDLLGDVNSKSTLRVREHQVLGPYVEGLTKMAVKDFEQIQALMEEGNRSRTVAATNMNAESSRSHAIFLLVITQSEFDPATKRTGEKVSRLSLVDLAGSERSSKTGASGARLKEGANINQSLTTLGMCIAALADMSGGKHHKKGAQAQSFIPYRDSVLTWLLKDSLGGNSKTVMIATISPALDNFEETLSTLRYADRAKRIVNHAEVNEDPTQRLIRELREEVEKLRSQLGVGGEGVPGAYRTPEQENEETQKLRDQLRSSEALMKEMSMTWEEKLQATEKNLSQRQKQLEELGISVQAGGIAVDNKRFYLVNLNEDPALSEMLVYYLKEHVTHIGSSKSQDIVLSGLGVGEEHAQLLIEDNDVFVVPLAGKETFVNGQHISEKTLLYNGSRLALGSNHIFRVTCARRRPKPAEVAADAAAAGAAGSLPSSSAAAAAGTTPPTAAPAMSATSPGVVAGSSGSHGGGLAVPTAVAPARARVGSFTTSTGTSQVVAAAAAAAAGKSTAPSSPSPLTKTMSSASAGSSSAGGTPPPAAATSSLGIAGTSPAAAAASVRNSASLSSSASPAGTRMSTLEPVPQVPEEDDEEDGRLDWEMAMEELAASRMRWEQEKEAALEEQRIMYERKINQLVALGEDVTKATAQVNKETDEEAVDLERLKNLLMDVSRLVEEANQLSKELKNGLKFNMRLRPSLSALMLEERTGPLSREVVITVDHIRKKQSYASSLENFLDHLDFLRNTYQATLEGTLKIDASTKSFQIPTYVESAGSTIIGVANFPLRGLKAGVNLDFEATLVNYEGKSLGVVAVVITLDNPRVETVKTDDDEDAEPCLVVGSTFKGTVAVVSAKGLPNNLSALVFCKYSFMAKDVDPVPEDTQTEKRRDANGTTVFFDSAHPYAFEMPVNGDLLNFLGTKFLSVQVWGQSEYVLEDQPGYLLRAHTVDHHAEADLARAGASDAESQRNALHQSLAERWSNHCTELDVWTQVMEPDDSGVFVAAPVFPRLPIVSGGIIKIRQGVARKLSIQIRQVRGPKLAVECVNGVWFGTPHISSKNDDQLVVSKLADDVGVFRNVFSLQATRALAHIDESVRNNAKSQSTAAESSAITADLLVHRMKVFEERDAIQNPARDSGLPGCSMSATDVGYDTRVPVILSVADVDKSIKQERIDTSHMSPLHVLTEECDTHGTVIITASWDMSMHARPELQKVSLETQWVYVPMYVALGLQDGGQEIFVRQMLCFKVYKRSQTFKKTMAQRVFMTAITQLTGCGIKQMVVSSLPSYDDSVTVSESEQQPAGDVNLFKAYQKNMTALSKAVQVDDMKMTVYVQEMLASPHKSRPSSFRSFSGRAQLGVRRLQSASASPLRLPEESHSHSAIASPSASSPLANHAPHSPASSPGSRTPTSERKFSATQAQAPSMRRAASEVLSPAVHPSSSSSAAHPHPPVTLFPTQEPRLNTTGSRSPAGAYSPVSEDVARDEVAEALRRRPSASRPMPVRQAPSRPSGS
eukprot:m.205913 g.205913  ORF g.205913 m.205913 type:complete len:1651 (-) comp17770_c0_seq1:288-5240(-)